MAYVSPRLLCYDIIIPKNATLAVNAVRIINRKASMAGTNLGTAWIQIKPSMKGMTSSIRSELSGVGDAGGAEIGSKFSAGFAAKMGAVAGIVQQVFGKITSVVSSSFDSAISRADTLNNFSNVMSNLNISQEQSQASIEKLSDKLTGLPTSLDSAASAVQRFTTANGDVDKSTNLFLALNNALLAGGASADVQSTALEQISQAYAKGKPDMVEWRSVLTAMPAQAKQLADALGYVSTEDLGEALRKGTLSMDDFMAKVTELNTQGAEGFKSFEEQAKASTDTIQTKMANVQTSLTKVITAALNGDDMAKPIEQFAERVNELAPVMIKGFVNGFLGVAQAIPKIIPTVVQAVVDQLPAFINGIVLLFQKIVAQLPSLISVLVNAIPVLVNSLVTAITAPSNLAAILQGFLALIMASLQAFPVLLQSIIEALPTIITNIVGFLTDPNNIMMIIQGAVQLFMGIVQAVPQILGALLGAFGSLVGSLWDWITARFGEFAANFGNFIGGIFRNAINGVLSFIENVINGPIDIINGFIGAINDAFGFIGVNLGKIGRISLPRLATGGIVQGIGTDTSDSNLYALSKGEYVIRAAAARNIGYENLDKMNQTGEVSGGQINYFTINGYNKSPEELANIISRKIAFNQRGVIG